ncbi:lysophospholipase [candidate division KSB1 bacterium]|nr:lysophospholipase [candidate division KSB1 bacterium]
MKARFIFVLLISLLLLLSCTTIKLTEKEAFNVKRTISPEYFENTIFKLEKVSIPSGDRLLLTGWFIKNDSATGTVLYYGGNGFVMAISYDIIKSIIDQNVDLLVFDYRGYGENAGTPTVPGLKTDGLAAYDFLVQEKKIDPKRLIIHGHSMGSFIAAYVADNREAAGLVLECPITDAKDWTGMLVPWFLKPFVKFEIELSLLENSNVARITSIEKPLLIFAGDKDQVTPSKMAEKLFEAAKSTDKKLVIIENGGHNDLPQRSEYTNALKEFYSRIFSADGN